MDIHFFAKSFLTESERPQRVIFQLDMVHNYTKKVI
jgi:hypothetical protein